MVLSEAFRSSILKNCHLGSTVPSETSIVINQTDVSPIQLFFLAWKPLFEILNLYVIDKIKTQKSNAHTCWNNTTLHVCLLNIILTVFKAHCSLIENGILPSSLCYNLGQMSTWPLIKGMVKNMHSMECFKGWIKPGTGKHSAGVTHNTVMITLFLVFLAK